SATMPPPIAALTKEMLHNPLMIDLGRRSLPAVGITQAVYPVKQDLKKDLLLALLDRGEMSQALVFTRTKHRANRLAEQLVKRGIKAERIHGNRSQSQRTAALAGFKNGHYKVLVATDIAARGIDIEALGHVVNFDVPQAPDDYIHRVGRTARAGEVGDAFTFVAPDEQNDLRAIEKAIGKRLPQITIPDFDYNARPEGRLEIPIGERIAAIRGRKADERARSKAKAARSASSNGSHRPHSSSGSARPAGSGSGSSGGSGRSGGSGDSHRSGGPYRSRRGR
ncbi:MAG TPA: helicase-related protein, partial [Gemmatimonadaceae bacterium]|nr:helicase-related protein [Gemmatimonadaceae bacterium]